MVDFIFNLFCANWGEKYQFTHVLWIFCGVICHQVGPKTVTNEVEVPDVSHGDTPPLEVVIEILNRFFGCEVVVIVFGTAARSHTDDFNIDDLKVLGKRLRTFVKQGT